MTERSLPHDPVAGSADAFAVEAARRLAFLSTPAPMPTGSLDVLRGDQRVFDPMRLTAASAGARSEAAARDVAAATGLGDQVPGASTFPGLFGVDVGSLTIAQLMQVMVECVAEMVQRQHQAAAGARDQVPPSV